MREERKEKSEKKRKKTDAAASVFELLGFI